MPSQRPEGEVDHGAEGVDHGAQGVDDENPPVDRGDDNEDPPVDEKNVAEDVAEDEDGDDDGHAPVVPEDGYGGGPSDLSLLHEYHKHRANQIWEATNSEAPILKKVMRSVANGKKHLLKTLKLFLLFVYLIKDMLRLRLHLQEGIGLILARHGK
ncbi:hypothetical protein P8452_51724 [Trifolium repens]|nr:hypothetical protein P8452_51724 [Trifolium repens]